MAQVSTDGKSATVELNLVPFIDLLSTLTLFLLVTTVWLQVAAIPAAIDSKGSVADANTPQKRVEVSVTNSGYRITWPTEFSGARFPGNVARGKKGSETVQLTAAIKGAYQSVISSKKNFPMAAVTATDEVEYGAVVEAVDALKTAGVPIVALKTN